MRMPVLLILFALGWLLIEPLSAEVIDAHFGQGLWATGYVRSVHHILVFDLGNETIRGNTGGTKVWLGASTDHPNLFQYLEVAKKKGILVRLHGYFAKTPPNILAQYPFGPSVRFTIDKMHSTQDPDR